MNKNRRAPMGMGRGRGNNEKAKDLGGTLKKLLAYLKPYQLFLCKRHSLALVDWLHWLQYNKQKPVKPKLLKRWE